MPTWKVDGVYGYNPNDGEAETGEFLGSPVSQTRLIIKYQVPDKDCLKN